MYVREKILEAALQGLLREFVPSRDKFTSDRQRDAFAAALAALRSNARLRTQ
jgi:hypothetical protein